MRLPTVLPLLFLAGVPTPLAAQEGGEPETLLHFDGGGPSERLGEAISFGGDINNDGTPDLLVGAPFADTSGLTRNGMVLAYSGLTGGLLYQFDGSASFENFGSALAGLGDINGDGFGDILIGSAGADPLTFTDAGEIDIYSGIDGSLLLHLDGSVDFGEFGMAVAALGDLDGDLIPDFAVSEPGRNSDAGRVYIYSGLSGSILFQNDGSLGDRFGAALSTAGDFDGNGTTDYLVGCPFADTGLLTDNGTASIFSGSTGLELQLYEGQASNDHFGEAVSGGLPANMDAIPDLVIGIPNRDPGGAPGAGSAILIDGATGMIAFQQNGTALADNFGSSVAMAGDFNGDGFGDWSVGARLRDGPGGFDSGVAFVFSGRDGTVLLRADGVDAQDNFGDSVIGGVDVDGDGFADVAFAAPLADSVAQLSGTVDVLRLVPILDVSALEVSAASGGSIDFPIDFPVAEAGRDYILLGSASGLGPKPYQGVSIPLTVDPFFQLMVAGGPPQFSANTGTLDASGDASANLNLGSGDASGVIGTTLYFSVVSHQGGSPRLVSNARGLLILP